MHRSDLCVTIIKHGDDHLFPIYDQRMWVRGAVDIQFSSTVPGGFDVLTFRVSVLDARWEWLNLRRNFEVLVTDGLKCVWSGRLEDVKPSTAGTYEIKAMGWAKNTRDRLVETLTYGVATTGKDIIEDALAFCPRIDTDYSDIEDPGIDLQDQEWDMVPAATVLQDVCDAGDSQTPPRVWYWGIWCSQYVTGDAGAEDVDVAAQNDDAYSEPSVPTILLSQDRLMAGTSAAKNYTIGMRFLNLQMAQGAVIDSAYLKVYAYDTGLNAGAFSIYGEDIDSSTAFSVSPNRPDEKTKTTANVAWSPAAWIAGTQYTSPDIASVIKEIVDRAGWAPGNDLSLLVTKAGNFGRWRSYDYAPAGNYAPTLEVNWHLPAVRRAKARAWPREIDTWEYEVWGHEVEGGVELIRGTDGLANAVRVEYDAGAGATWTAWDTDTDSIADNDRRDFVSRIGTAAAAVGTNVRDMELEARKDIRRVAGSIKVKGLISKRFSGLQVPTSWVRAGERILVKDIDYGLGIVYLIKTASYSDSDKSVTITPDGETNTIRAWLAQQMTD